MAKKFVKAFSFKANQQTIVVIEVAYSISSDCAGCGACARLCPVSAISGSLKEIHIINPKRCIECGVCGRVCNRGAVLDHEGRPVAKVPRQEWPYPIVDTKRCTACRMCVDACGHQALKISDPSFKGDISVYAVLIDRKKCVGCGLCAQTCPVQAIKMGVKHEAASLCQDRS